MSDPLKWRHGHWHINTWVAGRRLRRSTKTADKKQAALIAAKEISRAQRIAEYGPDQEATFADAVVFYLRDGKPDRFIEPIFEKLSKQRLADIHPGTIKSLCKELYPDAAPATWNRQVIAPARAVINHAHELGLCPPIRIKKFKEPKSKKVAIGQAWIERFCVGADPYVASAMLFMFTSGARISEVVKITPDHCDYESGVITLPANETKTGEIREFYIIAALLRILRSQDARRTRDGMTRVFGYQDTNGLRKAIRARCAAIGLDYIPPHQAGRHSFATEMIVRRGIDPVTVAKLGGWASPKVLLDTYAHAEGLGKVADDTFGEMDTKWSRPKIAQAKNNDNSNS